MHQPRIETKLKKQFEDLFTQMDQKINSFKQTYNDQHAKQEKVNANVAKQLGYLV